MFSWKLPALAVAIGVGGLGYNAYAKHEADVKLQADIDAEARRIAYLAVETSVTMNNQTGGTATLFTATPNGRLADGSTDWIQNPACTAGPHEKCSVNVYAHRGIQVYSKTNYVYLGVVTSHSTPIMNDIPTTIEAWHNTSDDHCCFLNADAQAGS